MREDIILVLENHYLLEVAVRIQRDRIIRDVGTNLPGMHLDDTFRASLRPKRGPSQTMMTGQKPLWASLRSNTLTLVSGSDHQLPEALVARRFGLLGL